VLAKAAPDIATVSGKLTPNRYGVSSRWEEGRKKLSITDGNPSALRIFVNDDEKSGFQAKK
jgi:hypothetical protein